MALAQVSSAVRSRAVSARPAVRQAAKASRVTLGRSSLHQQPKRWIVRAETDSSTPSVDVDKLVKDLQEKWDKVENKTSVAVYGGVAITSVWLASTIVGAINNVPLLPKLFELIGLGYSAWFVYRYLLFKSSREELIKDVDELKKKITGASS